MRCPNCGYTSFDYLDRCLKCEADLTEERTRLNHLDLHPDPISLLAIMERMPQIIQKKVIQEKEKTVNSPLSTSPASVPDSDLGFSLDKPIPLDLNFDLRESKIPQTKKEDLEIVLEGLDLSPSPEKEDR
jgi:hypothetical protein